MADSDEITNKAESTGAEENAVSAAQSNHSAVSPSDCFTALYLPSFYEEYMDFEKKPPERYGEELASKNWMTDELLDEIKQCLPTEDAIQNTNGDNIRDRDALAIALERLFPVGRVFASLMQLDQMIRKVGSVWAFQVVHPSHRYACHYSRSMHKKRRLHPDKTKRRKVYHDIKGEIDCPFRIFYRAVDKPTRKEFQKPRAYYKVRIYRAVYQHTCELSTSAYHNAKTRGGLVMPDLNGVSDIIALLRLRPKMSASELRPLIKKYIPHYVTTNTKFVLNFKSRCLRYIANHREDELPSPSEGIMICNNNEETSGGNDSGDETDTKPNAKDGLNPSYNWKDQFTRKELQEMLQTAEKAALAAGCIVRIYLGCGSEGSEEDSDEPETNLEDIISLCDRQAQNAIEDIVRTKYPEHSFLGKANLEPGVTSSEEALLKNITEDFLWICDPIDGTVNFASGLSLCAVTLTFVYKGTPVLGVVYDPNKNEMFNAIRENGAFLKQYKQEQESSESAVLLRERKLRVAKAIQNVQDSVIIAGCPDDPNAFHTSMLGVMALNGKSRGTRVIACSSLATAWVAAGRLTAYFGHDINTWDLVAGALLIHEAGGLITDLDGTPYQLTTRNMFCSNGVEHVHTGILQILHKACAVKYIKQG